MKTRLLLSVSLISSAFVCGSIGEEVAMKAERAFVITFDSQSQRTYKLLAAENAAGNWATLQDGIVGTGGEVTVFYKSESDQRLFFKVETSDGPPGQRSLLSLANLDISNRDLSGYDLEGDDLRGFKFFSSIFQDANLSAANLSEANFTEANFTGADLSHAVAVEVSMHGANLNGADLTGIHFVQGDLGSADLRNANLTGVSFTGTALNGANFSGQTLTNFSFRGLNLESANFFQANLAGADLSRTDSDFINLTHANILGVNFEGAHLAGADLHGQAISTIRFRGARIDGGNWSSVNAGSVDMSLATVGPGWNPSLVAFLGANMEGLVAGSPDFSWGLTNVSFKNANLRGAYLEGMIFRNCDFTGADLSFANVIAADFTGCTGLDPEQPGMQFGGWPQNPPPAPPRPTATILPDGTPRSGTNPGTGLAPATSPAQLQLVINDGGINTTSNLQLDGFTFSEGGVEAGTFTYSAIGRKAVLTLNHTATGRTSVRTLLFTSPTEGELYNSDSGASFQIGTFTVPQQ